MIDRYWMQVELSHPPSVSTVTKPVNDVIDTGTTINETPSSLDNIVQQEAVVIPLNNRRRPDRFNTSDFDDTQNESNINHELCYLADGLEREGIKLDKQIEAEVLINQLYKSVGVPSDAVGKECLHLYSMETFLSSERNRFLCEEDRTKIETYGPFVRLLCFYFNQPSSIEVPSIEVYCRMDLSSSMIDAGKEGAKRETSFRWAGFSSTS
ncbi:unnamed protein product [Didymodactylos carnosus]|uniref:Uncharacterized protein n=1 Tax=Didymodactylos carnosus TaxID=1234261 RepID=A0A815KFV0_9BILA|nr:unnamed protein product [Didymodactylos carnosus]CAF1395410.1 unnamed protein product [Didymodactylos carnosus]CAF4037348.1 unnamed protein product [Didymodactylos carnosus]CAF4289600.1 unnamed protein product [Didymodactylos carnosus]